MPRDTVDESARAPRSPGEWTSRPGDEFLYAWLTKGQLTTLASQLQIFAADNGDIIDAQAWISTYCGAKKPNGKIRVKLLKRWVDRFPGAQKSGFLSSLDHKADPESDMTVEEAGQLQKFDPVAEFGKSPLEHLPSQAWIEDKKYIERPVSGPRNARA